MNILAILYFLVSFFYIFFAVALLFFPKKIKLLFPALFPLLESFRFPLIINTICLASVGIFLYLIGSELILSSLWGWYFAFVLSLWEIFLVFGFYLPHKKHWSAAIHFALHLFLVVMIANIIILGYSLQINTMQSQFTTTMNVTGLLP